MHLLRNAQSVKVTIATQIKGEWFMHTVYAQQHGRLAVSHYATALSGAYSQSVIHDALLMHNSKSL